MKRTLVVGLFSGFALLAASPDNSAGIRWAPPGVVVVDVINREFGKIPGAAVSLRRSDAAPDAPPFRSATTNGGGRAEFRDLPAGTYLVHVERAGSLPACVGPAEIDAKTPPSVRLPEILVVMNPVLSF